MACRRAWLFWRGRWGRCDRDQLLLRGLRGFSRIRTVLGFFLRYFWNGLPVFSRRTFRLVGGSWRDSQFNSGVVVMTSTSGFSPRTATSLPRMHTDSRGLEHFEITEKIIGIFYDVYNELGHGFLESVYEQALAIALAEHQIFFQRQIAIPVWFHGRQIGDFRADLLVDSKVIVELKVGRAIESAWEKQLLNYLQGTEIEVGLLLNFGPTAQFRRLIFDNERKKIRENPCESAEEKLEI